jgi:hypothetical protein
MTELEEVIICCPEELCEGVPFYQLQQYLNENNGRCLRCSERKKYQIETKKNGNCEVCKNGTRCHPMVRIDKTCYYCDRPLIHIFNEILMKYSIKK